MGDDMIRMRKGGSGLDLGLRISVGKDHGRHERQIVKSEQDTQLMEDILNTEDTWLRQAKAELSRVSPKTAEERVAGLTAFIDQYFRRP